MQMSIEESLTDMSTMCFQAALLYTSSKGLLIWSIILAQIRVGGEVGLGGLDKKTHTEVRSPHG